MAKEVKNVLIDEDYWKLTKYKAWEQPYIKATVNVVTTSAYTPILGAYSDLTQVDKMYIDGVLLDEPVKQYTFDTLGEHIIDIVFVKDAKLGQMRSQGWFFGTSFVNILDVKLIVEPYIFRRMTNLESINTDNLLADINEYSIYSLFADCQNLKNIKLKLDGTKLINIESLFEGCYSLESVYLDVDVSNIDNSRIDIGVKTSRVENPILYYNARYDYSKIIAELPENWAVIPVYE